MNFLLSKSAESQYRMFSMMTLRILIAAIQLQYIQCNFITYSLS